MVDGDAGVPRELLDAWVEAWAISRGAPAPVAVPGGWWIQVGLPGHRLRYVLREPDHELLVHLGEEQGSPGAWIKMTGDPARLHAALPAPWEPAETGHLMTIELRSMPVPPAPASVTSPAVPAGYTLRLGDSSAEVLDAGGRTAASAKLVTVGTVAMIDQVETVPAHRRRGLGSVVMRALAEHARSLGAETGVLVATDQGRHLYRSLGWTVRAPFPAARVPEPADEGSA
ncbi:hypothetical protein Acy02nite_86920 [Actinoplanes cyaneus]|uniref:N-acetyltransferase domain-containing protein n=1 Tax=Actinoplanes cyaneus TaxID=52696 RepID=A0A919ITM8_9ACTN|nr:GNAT family N-acetyltransferase [Actinoplanes cyaneus]MCW2144011.1 Acetyltransferase (GNAT) family protein [Actinoplanes cyaneus]GID70811.1 hypothetical protein Acy02nite_86920 [Actinoplanes cyaneus]